VTCSEKQPMFCMNLSCPQSLTHVEFTQFAQDSIRCPKLKAALLSSQTHREKLLGFTLWPPGFMDFMVSFILWTLNRHSVKVLQKYRPPGEVET